MTKWKEINPKWNSFDTSLLSVVIIDGENKMQHEVKAGSSISGPINGFKSTPYSGFIALTGADIKFKGYLGKVSESSNIAINPKAIMKIKENKIKIRTMSALTSEAKITKNAYEAICKYLGLEA